MSETERGKITKAHMLYFAYWTLGAIFLGMLVGPFVLPSPDAKFAALHAQTRQMMPPKLRASMEDHATHFTHDHMMEHGTIDVPPEGAPQVGLVVERDVMSGWNVRMKLENFTFTPQNINTGFVANEGHAHIYVDGEKISRVYGPDYYLANMLPGPHEIKVSLNANTHDTLAIDGVPISATVMVHQPMASESCLPTDSQQYIDPQMAETLSGGQFSNLTGTEKMRILLGMDTYTQ